MTWMGKTCANIGSKIEVICDGESVGSPRRAGRNGSFSHRLSGAKAAFMYTSF